MSINTLMLANEFLGSSTFQTSWEPKKNEQIQVHFQHRNCGDPTKTRKNLFLHHSDRFPPKKLEQKKTSWKDMHRKERHKKTITAGSHCVGSTFVWREVCYAGRHAIRHQPLVDALQHVHIDVGVVQLDLQDAPAGGGPLPSHPHPHPEPGHRTASLVSSNGFLI